MGRSATGPWRIYAWNKAGLVSVIKLGGIEKTLGK
jgi:hypothetical protein